MYKVKNKTAAQKILLISIYVLSLAIAWQAIRFSFGNASVPLLDIPAEGTDFYVIRSALYYFAGVSFWLGASLLSFVILLASSRVMSIGIQAAWKEFKKEIESHNKTAKANTIRQKHRQVQKVLRNKTNKSKTKHRYYLIMICALWIGVLFYLTYA